MNEHHSKLQSLREELNNQIFGQQNLIDEALCCLLAQGHMLITGVPGLAKTSLVRALAEKLGMKFGRVQCTPDLLPSDITGSEILQIDQQSQKREFQFVKGPIFVNLLLADEINRASPRTQSALLEAMQERSCTISSQTHRLPDPFVVFATQNPIESEGTFVLPEAQLDRFLMQSSVDYPPEAAEVLMLENHAKNTLIGSKQHDLGKSSSEVRITQHEVLAMIEAVRNISVPQIIIEAISKIVRSSRPSDGSCNEKHKSWIRYGAGPRAGLAIISAARAFAFLEQKESVAWRHVERSLKPVLRHRISLKAQATRDAMTVENLVNELVENFKVAYEGKLLSYE